MIKDGFGLIFDDVIDLAKEEVIKLMHSIFICHDSEIGLDAPELAIQLNNTIRVLCIYSCPILRMVVVDLEDCGCVFKQSLEFLVSIVLWVFFNVERFGLTELVDERELASDLVAVAYQFG